MKRRLFFSLFLIIFLVAAGFLFTPVQAALSPSVFPQSLHGFPLEDVETFAIEDWEKEYGVQECYIAYYYDERGEIDVDIVRLADSDRTVSYMEEVVPSAKEAYAYVREAESQATFSKTVNGYPARHFRSTTGSDYTDYYYKYGIDLYVAASNYLIDITVSRDTDEPSLFEAEEAARQIIDALNLTKASDEPSLSEPGSAGELEPQARTSPDSKVSLLVKNFESSFGDISQNFWPIVAGVVIVLISFVICYIKKKKSF